MYNIVLISPSLLTSCLHTDTLSKPPSQSSEVRGDRKDSKTLGKAVTQTGYTFASHSIYSHLSPFWHFKKKIICYKWQKKNNSSNNNTWRVLVYERPPNKPGHAAFWNKQPFPPCINNSKWWGPHSAHPPPPPWVSINSIRYVLMDFQSVSLFKFPISFQVMV